MKKDAFVKNRRQIGASAVVRAVVLALFIVLTFLPIYILLVNSFKNPAQMLGPLLLPAKPFFIVNYVSAFKTVIGSVFNSVFITVLTVIGAVTLSVLSGYAFARFRFRFKNLLYALILVNLMIPGLLTLVPSFLIIVNVLHLYDNHFGLILSYIASGQIMGIFLTRNFVEGIPKTLFDAAKIDGAGELKMIVLIAVPLIKPIIVTVAILNIMSSWNEIVWPNLILLTESLYTIPIALLNFSTFYGSDHGKMFAGYVLVSLPLVVFFLYNMKSFLNSLVEGSVKG